MGFAHKIESDDVISSDVGFAGIDNRISDWVIMFDISLPV